MSDRLLSAKELADAFGRHVNWVYAMVADGFSMPGGRATVWEAREWLSVHPHPQRRNRGRAVEGSGEPDFEAQSD